VQTVVLATDLGEALRPLTDERTPTSFLSLGDRRPLMRQWVDRLSESCREENVWVIVASRFLERAEALLPEAVRVLSVEAETEVAALLSSELAKPEHERPEGSTVLLQPATQVIEDGEAYTRCASAAAECAASTGRPVALVADSDGTAGRPTGIHVWPTEALLRYVTDGLGLPAAEHEMETLPLENAGWIDLSDWEGIRRLLAYVEKPWGHERLWALNRHYAGKVLFIRAGESLSLQYHEVKDETIRITSGRMRFRVGPSADELETVVLEPGMSYAIPPRAVHQMEATEDCTVFEVSTPHLTDVVRIEDRYGRS